MPANRDALRALAEALPEGAALPVPREWLLELLAGATAPELPPQVVTSPETDDRLMTVEEVAARLDVTPQWVYRHAGEWSFTRRLGRRTLRFSEAGLRAYLARRRAA